MVSRSDFTLPPIDSGKVLLNLGGASALTKLVPQITLPGVGTILHTFSSGDAEYVTENGVKPVVATTSRSFKVTAEKFAKIVILSDELSDDARELTNAIYTEIPTSFATILDKIVIGTKAKPSAEFDTLSTAPSMEIETVADLYEAVDAVEATGATADGILFTSSMLNSLRSKVNGLGAPVFSIVGDEINGIPFAVTKNATKVAFVGPFATRAVWGVVAGYPKTDIELDSVEVEGVMRSLKQRNQIGVLGETRIGFRVADVNEFVKLVPAAPVA